jgi:tetratricopeptide (TPR) repeat protein
MEISNRLTIWPSARIFYTEVGYFLLSGKRISLIHISCASPLEIGYSILVYKLDLSDANIHYNVGLISAERGELSKAVLLFRQALRIQLEFADAHIHLAQTLALQGNKDEAVQYYNEALRILKSGPTTTKGH